MKLRQLTMVLIAVLAGTAPSVASAALSSDFHISLGYTGLNLTAGETYSDTLESMSALELNYNLYVSSMNAAVEISFFELIESNMNELPFTRFGLGGRWHFMGLNGERVILDSGTEGKMYKASPFIGASFGITSLSIADSLVFFNAVVMDVLPKIGIEAPIAANWLFVGQVGYFMTLKSGTSQDTDIRYSGLSIMLGFKLATI